MNTLTRWHTDPEFRDNAVCWVIAGLLISCAIWVRV